MRYDLHKMKINLKGHAKIRFDERYPKMSYELLLHHFRTGKIIKRPEKEGIVGNIIKKTKQDNILFKYIIRNGEIWIITIE